MKKLHMMPVLSEFLLFFLLLLSAFLLFPYGRYFRLHVPAFSFIIPNTCFAGNKKVSSTLQLPCPSLMRGKG
ncbi:MULTISPECIES: hypothetical protein, partial [Clostridia]|uniref:hypothetical protein n=1 Tax=Clostridia TaxID=186801 RepID=UPI001A9C1680